MIHQAQLMKISWAFLMAQGCGWLGAYEFLNNLRHPYENHERRRDKRLSDLKTQIVGERDPRS